MYIPACAAHHQPPYLMDMMIDLAALCVEELRGIQRGNAINSSCAFKNPRLTFKERICWTVLSRVTISLFSLRKQTILTGREFSEDSDYLESIIREKLGKLGV